MLEPFEMVYMQRAFMGGILVGLLASYFGPFVVQRKLAFLGSGLAHVAFGGVALGILLKTEPLITAVPFTIVIAIAIVWVREHSQLADDTSIGILFALSMALGIVFLAWSTGNSGDAFTYLFGSILAISTTDLWITGGLCVLMLSTFPLWRSWTYATFDRNLALADRIPVRLHDYAMAVGLAVTTVVSIKLVGIVLMSAFFVLPAATARIVSATFTQMTIYTAIIGVGSVILGLYAAYFGDLPGGAGIILVQTSLFGLALALRMALARR